MFASIERYVSLLITVIATVITARLFTPAEFGLTVLAGAIWALAEPIRDFGLNTYLIQQHDLTVERARTGFTLSFLITVAITTFVCLSAGSIEKFYELPGFRIYLFVSGLAFVLGPFVIPVYAMLRREMAFRTLTFINVTTITLNLIAIILFGLSGFGYMSFAWANLVSGTAGMLLGFLFRSDFSFFRPSLKEWREVSHYGAYDSSKNLLLYLMDSLPMLIFGSILTVEAIGFYNRAIRLAKLPGRIMLAGLGSVVLPAFAQRSRDGHELRASYLSGIEYLTAVVWPALVFLIIFAHPVVVVLLGSQWLEIVPLVQIIACACLIWYPVGLTDPALTAAGAIRDAFALAVVTTPVSIAVQTFAAFYGLQAIALSMLLTSTLYLVLAVYFVRRRIPFTLPQLGRAIGRSVIVTASSAVGPLLIIAVSGFRFDISILAAAFGSLLFAVGWFCGVWIAAHPLQLDIRKAMAMLIQFIKGVRSRRASGAVSEYGREDAP